MMAPTLSPPPGYEYRTLGPWFVSHVYGDEAKAGIMWTFESAIVRFWGHVTDSPPDRRTLVDARGVTVLGEDRTGDLPKIVGTREAMDAGIKMCENSDIDDIVEVFEVAEMLRRLNGESP